MINIPTSVVRLFEEENPSNARRAFLTPIPGLPNEFLHVIDNSSLEKVKRCHKMGENYLIKGRTPHATNAALTFGGAIHQGLELFHHEEYRKQQGLPELEEYNQFAQNAAISKFFLDNPAPSDHRTAASALEVLKHYRQRCNTQLYPDYEWEILADASGPIIERAFELPLTVLEIDDTVSLNGQEIYIARIHVAWSGRIDMITKSNGQVRVTDHKTSSILTPDYFKSFENSSQIRGYIWAGKQLWPDLSPSAFCHNGIFLKRHTPGSPLLARGVRGGEPPLSFARTYYPMSATASYSPEDISRWERDTILLIEDFFHSLVRGIFPMNDISCTTKYGTCEYFDVCTQQSEAVGNAVLMSDAFKTVTWNPTANR